ARLELAGKWGHEGAAFASSQGLSSLDAEDFGGVGEAWLQWSTGAGTGAAGPVLRVKAGRVDANSDFAYSDVAGGFGNPSFGLSPVLAILPSYPAPAASLNAFVRPRPVGPEVGAGVYRRADGEYTVVGQVTNGLAGPGSVRWSAGWVEPIGPGEPGRGAYLIVERSSEAGVSPFVMASGWVAGPRHLAAGATLPPLPLPVAAVAGVGASLLVDEGVGDEAVAEVFAALLPADWLRVQVPGQVHVARGTGPSLGGLFRVVVDR
ncbi:MAG: hypothetical protein P8177_14540, partial [Gemmatimonadota bacterium]